nr:uncharacterized protein CI109_002092 [Kwoniella shandongensis]KAA5529666.1 hypothetical protein CI109_002092 [Kwoniella shandongensis]
MDNTSSQMLSASPPPLLLGRPLSDDLSLPRDTSASSGLTSISQLSTGGNRAFTSVPLRRDDSESSRGRRETDDGHSLANTFGTMDRLGDGDDGRVVGEPFSDIHHHGDQQTLKLAPTPLPIRPTTPELPSRQIAGDSRRSDTSDETINPPLSPLHDPSEKRFMKAGVVAGSAAGAGAAGREVLASRGRGVGDEGGREPRGWENVQVDNKWGITSKQIKEDRWKAVKKGAVLYTFITFWLWICLSIFWGSNYRLTSFLPSLTVNLIPLDTPSGDSYLNGPMIQQANYLTSLPSSIVHLKWVVKDPADYPNGLQDVRDSIVAQDAWAAVVINANASSAWTNALQNGDANYDPTGAIGIYFSSARFYQVVLLYIEAIITEELANPLATARAQALRSFIASSTTNPTALTNAARVPQAVGVGFGYTVFDVRPIENTAWAGAAPMEASLIYFIIFAFYLAQYGGIARMKSGLQSRLRFSSMLKLRLGWPLLAYFFLSLWETLIIRAWQVPLNNHLGRAGFVTLWALNYFTIIAAGFAMETALAVVGISWLPFFLIMWIILNITSSFYPIEMMPNFYRFLRWTPFYHNVEGYKIIAFGSNLQHRLGLHFGALAGLIGVELIGLPLAIVFERWSMDKSQRKEAQEKREKEEKEREEPQRVEA